MTTRAALSLELLLFAISSGALAASPEDFGHFVPAEKKLSRRWFDSGCSSGSGNPSSSSVATPSRSGSRRSDRSTKDTKDTKRAGAPAHAP